MPKIITLTIALFLLTPMAHAADIIGAWSGTWTKAGDALPVVVTFAETDGKISGSFDSDALRVSGIPFREVAVDGDKVHIVLSGDASTTVFDGAIAGDHLDGTFVEGAVRGTFSLARATPVPPLATRETNFANGDVKLGGEIVLPATPGRHPAILFLHGSGPEGRWASRFLAQKFARAGFVALIYDKRGVGNSTGDWKSAGFDDLADDAMAGIRRLAEQPEVDPARIGIYGHSQGGSIAPVVAERAKTLAFIIGSAASATSPAELELYSLGNSIGLSQLPPAERADADRYLHELIAVAYDGKSRVELDVMAARFKGRSWFFDPPPPDFYYWAFSRRIAGYRPLDHWRHVRAPVMLLFGANDQRVPPLQSSSAIVRTLKAAGNKRVTLEIFPNADHTFMRVPAPPDGWPKSVPDYVEMTIGWALAQTS